MVPYILFLNIIKTIRASSGIIPDDIRPGAKLRAGFRVNPEILASGSYAIRIGLLAPDPGPDFNPDPARSRMAIPDHSTGIYTRSPCMANIN